MRRCRTQSYDREGGEVMETLPLGSPLPVSRFLSVWIASHHVHLIGKQDGTITSVSLGKYAHFGATAVSVSFPGAILIMAVWRTNRLKHSFDVNNVSALAPSGADVTSSDSSCEANTGMPYIRVNIGVDSYHFPFCPPIFWPQIMMTQCIVGDKALVLWVYVSRDPGLLYQKLIFKLISPIHPPYPLHVGIFWQLWRLQVCLSRLPRPWLVFPDTLHLWKITEMITLFSHDNEYKFLPGRSNL